LAAFTVYVVWNQFNELEEAIEAEVEDMLVLFRFAIYLRGRDALRNVEDAIRAYCRYVVDDEWSGMAAGNTYELTIKTFEEVFRSVHGVQFDDERDSAAWAEMIRKFEAVSDARRKRL